MFEWLFLLIPLGWLVWIYNVLVRDSHRVRAAWSDIDVQLKRRHELIPKLVAAVRQYSDYEQATLARVTELRQLSSQLDDPAEKANTLLQHRQHFSIRADFSLPVKFHVTMPA